MRQEFQTTIGGAREKSGSCRADLERGTRNVAEALRLPVEEVGGAPGAAHGCLVRRQMGNGEGNC
jgi:hypothetical protein